MKQIVASFFSKAFPYPIQAELYRDDLARNTTDFEKVATEQISVGRGDDPDFIISLMRTVRVPEDKTTYDLPPGLGRFPIFDIHPFSARLPSSMVAQGGVFFPMYRK
jgi:hypothetical protein